MNIFLQLLINGIIAGAIYSLVATGFSLIYSTNKFVHFAHGGVVISSAYFLYWLLSQIKINYYLSIPLTILFAGLIGYVLNRFIYKPFRLKGASNSILLIISISLLTLFESVILLLFGADVKMVNAFKSVEGVDFFGASLTKMQIIIVCVSIVLSVSLFVLMRKTKIGKIMRAVADNQNIAEIIGIDSEKIYSFAFVFSSAIAGVAAILILLEQNIAPTAGTNIIIKGFVASIVGGVGSLSGAILGSFLLGISENFGIWFISSSYKDAIAFILLFIFLLFRPSGILGVKSK